MLQSIRDPAVITTLTLCLVALGISGRAVHKVIRNPKCNLAPVRCLQVILSLACVAIYADAVWKHANLHPASGKLAILFLLLSQLTESIITHDCE